MRVVGAHVPPGTPHRVSPRVSPAPGTDRDDVEQWLVTPPSAEPLLDELRARDHEERLPHVEPHPRYEPLEEAAHLLDQRAGNV